MVHVESIRCHLKPLMSKEPGAGQMEFNEEVVEGYQSSSHHTEKVSAEVSSTVSASYMGVKAELQAKLGCEMTSSFTSNFSTSTKVNRFAKSEGPAGWYLYQAVTEVRLNGGEVLTFGGGIKAFASEQSLVWEKDFGEGVPSTHIRSEANSFICAPPGIGEWCTTASQHSGWETFRVVEQYGGKFAFKTFHGTWLKSHPDGRLETSGAVSAWEQFEIQRAEGNPPYVYHIKDYHGNYVSVPPTKDQVVKTAKGVNGGWEFLILSGLP